MKVTEFNVGRWCLSEDECIAQGIDFSAYERGVGDAAKAFGRNVGPNPTAHATISLPGCDVLVSGPPEELAALHAALAAAPALPSPEPVARVLERMATDPDLLEVGRKAVEDALVEYRDNGISEVGCRNGFVIRHKDGASSDLIRFNTRTGLGIALRAMAVEVATTPSPQRGVEPAELWKVAMDAFAQTDDKVESIQQAWERVAQAVIAAKAAPGRGVEPVGWTYGWLIENGKEQGRGLAYRFIDNDMGGIPGWTEDPNKALRFARREDAEQYAHHDEDAWRIVEHGWGPDAEPHGQVVPAAWLHECQAKLHSALTSPTQSAVQADVRDAMRYRFLRQQGGPGAKLFVRGDWSGYLGDYRHLIGDELDSAIDAAMRTAGATQGGE